MKFKKILCLALCAVMSCSLLASCASEEKPYDAADIKIGAHEKAQIAKNVNKALKTKDFTGGVSIAVNDSVVYSNSFGYADPVREHKLDGQTVYNISSMTKTFTAAAIFLLEKNSKLSRDDTLDKYFDASGKRRYLSTVKVGQLLSDKVSFGAYAPEIQSNAETAAVLKKYTHVANADKNNVKINRYVENYILDHGIVKDKNYLTSNYFLLGRIISKVSGTSYSDYVQKNIFDKLGMKNSGFISSKFNFGGYDLNNKKWHRGSEFPHMFNFGYMYSSYGIISCLDDMTKFYMALIDDTLGIDLVQKIRLAPSREYCGFKCDGNNLIAGGSVDIYSCYAHLNIQNNESVVIISNCSGRDDVMTTGEELYTVISSKVNGIIISSIKND